MKKQPIQGMDLDAQLVAGTPTPPNHKYNMVVTRKTRIAFPWSSTATSFNISMNDIMDQDKTDYNPGGAHRFLQGRISRVEAWYSYNVAVGTNNIYCTLVDAPSGAEFKDFFAIGVDYAHLAYRPSLFTRSTWRPASDTTVLITAALATPVAGDLGQVILDVTFEAC
jgi:hypothetical protein